MQRYQFAHIIKNSLKINGLFLYIGSSFLIYGYVCEVIGKGRVNHEDEDREE